MLHLFVPPAAFKGWSEYPYGGTTLDPLAAGVVVIVSVGALALAVYRILVMLLAG